VLHAGAHNQPCTCAQTRCLLEIAKLTRDEGFLPQPLFERVEAFNSARIEAIHKLLKGNVTLAELEIAAQSVTPIYGEIQALWLPSSIGPELAK